MKCIAIDDEPLALKQLTDYISRVPFLSLVKSCQDAFEAMKVLADEEIDLIFVDINMPDLNGLDFIRSLISRPMVIFTTAYSEYAVDGFKLDAVDYLLKPFLPQELLLRTAAILRRTYKEETPLVKLAGSQIDFSRAEVIKGKEQIPLTAKEYEILQALYRNAGRIVTIDQLCEAAWGENPFGYENSLMAHIRRIREKIEEHPSSPVSLLTVRGLGYKLTLADKE